MSFLAAVGFLTRVPVRIGVLEPERLARAVAWFPTVGALVGAAVAGSYAVLLEVVPPALAALVAVGVGIVLTGAFHEDGLADVSDALGAGDRDDAERILKDPRLGTYGVTAIVVTFALRSAALATMDAWTAAAIVPCAHAVARAGPTMLMRRPAVADDGLGAAFASAATTRSRVAAVASAVVIGAVLVGAWVGAALVASAGAVLLVGRLAVAKIGRVTGDFLGAAEQLGETAVLTLGAAIVYNGWPAAAWWH